MRRERIVHAAVVRLGIAERRWNEKLIAVRQLEDEFEAVEQQRALVLGDEEQDRLLRLGAASVHYIPGNHDEFLRDYYGTHFGGIEVVEHAIHVGVDGKRYLVIHGDLFDIVIRHARWLALLVNNVYDMAIWLNTQFNAARRKLGLIYWSLSQWAKLKVKNAVNFIEYESTLAAEAGRRSVDGVICGHIHHAVIRNDFGI